jgi:hypothetical protein
MNAALKSPLVSLEECFSKSRLENCGADAFQLFVPQFRSDEMRKARPDHIMSPRRGPCRLNCTYDPK